MDIKKEVEAIINEMKKFQIIFWGSDDWGFDGDNSHRSISPREITENEAYTLRELCLSSMEFMLRDGNEILLTNIELSLEILQFHAGKINCRTCGKVLLLKDGIYVAEDGYHHCECYLGEEWLQLSEEQRRM